MSEVGLDSFDHPTEPNIRFHALVYEIEGVDRGRMIAVEVIANCGKRSFRNGPANIHSHLPAKCDVLRPGFRHQLLVADAKFAGYVRADAREP
jgi:hypothetical protein